MYDIILKKCEDKFIKAIKTFYVFSENTDIIRDFKI